MKQLFKRSHEELVKKLELLALKSEDNRPEIYTERSKHASSGSFSERRTSKNAPKKQVVTLGKTN